MMKFDELVRKHKKIAKERYAKYKALGNVEINIDDVEKEEYRRIIFEHHSGIFRQQLKTMEDIVNLDKVVKERIKYIDGCYYNVKPSISMSAVEINASTLVHKNQMDRFADFENHQYYFARDFTEIVKIECNIQYLSKIECAVIKMYREDIITLDQLIKSVRSC